MIVETEFITGTQMYEVYFKTTVTVSAMAEAFISGEPVLVHFEHQDGNASTDGDTYLYMVGYDPEYGYTKSGFDFHYDETFYFTGQGINLHNSDSSDATEFGSDHTIDNDGYIRFAVYVD